MASAPAWSLLADEEGDVSKNQQSWPSRYPSRPSHLRSYNFREPVYSRPVGIETLRVIIAVPDQGRARFLHRFG